MSESDLSEQFNKGKIGVTLNGQKLKGRFYLVRTSTENQWLLFKKSDQFDSKEDLTISKPESVLTGRSNDQLANTTKRKQNRNKSDSLYKAKNSENSSNQKVSQQQGVAVFENIKKISLEGIIAKRKNSKYIQGTRSKDWLKVKNTKTQDCVVIGYTRGEGNREKYFGSLILAVYEQGRLRFAGHTGSGFNTKQLERVYTRIKDMQIDKPPIDHIPYINGRPTWIKPQLVAEIKFDNWTNEKILRAPIFQRFREDNSPEDCVIQGERHLEGVIVQGEREDKAATTTPTINQKRNPLVDSFSNLDKVYWDRTSKHPQLTKRDLIEYYDSVSNYILPHLKDRPLSLSRYPDGIKGKSFYHKNWNQARPDYVKTVKVYSETRGGVINYILGNNKETLLWIANLGCIEMHPWYSRVIDSDSCKNSDELDEDKCGLSFPDFVIFDLDPYIYSGNENKGEEPEYNVKGFKSTVEVAFHLKDLFDELKIISYIKTSGKTGLHIFVPIIRAYSYDQTRAFAESVGEILMKRIPKKITTVWDTTQRRGRVFFDYNQNAKGKTIASIFSARPSVSATISMPVKWEELDGVLPSDFTMLNVPDILKGHADPWRDILGKGQDLAKILDNLSSK